MQLILSVGSIKKGVQNMRNLVAVYPPQWIVSAISNNTVKRDIMFWHKIAIPQFDKFLSFLESWAEKDKFQGARDLLWLWGKGVITSVELNPEDVSAEIVHGVKLN